MPLRSKMHNSGRKQIQLFLFAAMVVLFPVAVHARVVCFTVAAYNVENLFDTVANHTEYPEYVPNSRYGWNRRTFNIKLNHIGRVIVDLDPDVIGLEEIESPVALAALQQRIAKMGDDYPYSAIAEEKRTTVRCALLSKFPIVSHREIFVPGKHTRNILEAELDIGGRRLILFVNHWKSKTGPESARIIYARALANAVSHLAPNADYLLVGDFNADYDESETLPQHPTLNDTRGVAGINQILETEINRRLVNEAMLTNHKNRRLHYNLWLELLASRRWSIDFYGRKGTPDAILVPRGLYDGKGIAYIDNSFNKFDPNYLFDNGGIFRWQRAAHGKGRFLGRGYSDHLPVFARFTTAPFAVSTGSRAYHAKTVDASIAELYRSRSGSSDGYRLYDCVVIYKNGDNAVIKQKNGRAVYLYHAAAELSLGGIYRLTVTGLHRYHGNLEIKAISNIEQSGKVRDVSAYYLNGRDTDFANPALQNDIVGRCEGVYRNHDLNFSAGRHIHVFFKRKQWIPPTGCHLILRGVRISYYDRPELVVETPGQAVVRRR